jgi:hypothetical protein
MLGTTRVIEAIDFLSGPKVGVISHNLRDTFQTRMQQRRERQFKGIGYYQYAVVLFFSKLHNILKVI